MDPSAKREQDERRLTGLKVGAVAITVAGLGVFAGLAAAGTDDSPAPVSAVSPGAASTPSASASDAARAAEDDSFFDDQAQSGAVGGYEGYADADDDGPGGHHGHHGTPPGAYGGQATGGDSAGQATGGDSAGQADVAPGGGWGASQGSTGGS